MTAAELDAHLYEFREKDAVRHIFRVASSLDSMVVGEAQILGQVKEAYATARAVGAVRGQLDQLFTRAFAVAKRVRTETAVGTSSVSIASVAVELAKKIFGTLQGKNVFIVGAGKMSELAARHLMAHGCASIFVANRTYDRAIGLAQKFNGQAIKFEDLYNSCDRADIVITSTGAPHAIFRREHGEQFLARRKNKPMFFIDIAVPRDVSPEMAKLDGIFAYDIDDLQQAVSRLAFASSRCQGWSDRSFLFGNSRSRLASLVQPDRHCLFAAGDFLAAAGRQGSFLKLVHYFPKYAFTIGVGTGCFCYHADCVAVFRPPDKM